MKNAPVLEAFKLRWRDLNPRPLAYEAIKLTNCSTSQDKCIKCFRNKKCYQFTDSIFNP